VTIVLPLAGIARAESTEQKGLTIARRADAANSGFRGEHATIEMVLVNAHGDKTRRKMISATLETSSDGDKSRIEFLWPADVKGTRMLTWTHKRGSDDQWLYLPAIKRVKRISSRNKSGSFVGSEFSYEDLGSQEVEQFHHKWLAVVKLAGRNAWKLQRIPNDKKSGYSREIVWSDKKYNNALKIEYYDRKGELLKTAKFSAFKRYGKWWRANQIDMVNHQTRKRSSLTWQMRKLGVQQDDDDFDSDELAD